MIKRDTIRFHLTGGAVVIQQSPFGLVSLHAAPCRDSVDSPDRHPGAKIFPTTESGTAAVSERGGTNRKRLDYVRSVPVLGSHIYVRLPSDLTEVASSPRSEVPWRIGRIREGFFPADHGQRKTFAALAGYLCLVENHPCVVMATVIIVSFGRDNLAFILGDNRDGRAHSLEPVLLLCAGILSCRNRPVSIRQAGSNRSY